MHINRRQIPVVITLSRYQFQFLLFFHIEQGGSFLVKTSFQLFFSSHFHLCVRMCACVVNWSEYFSKMNTYCRIGSNLCIVQHTKFVIFFIPFSFSFKIRVNDSIYVHFCHDVGIPAPTEKDRLSVLTMSAHKQL